MSYFSELLIAEMERQEHLFDCDPFRDDSNLAIALQMRGRLAELKDCLKDYIFWDNLVSFQRGRARRSWETVYKEWPEYWNDKRTDLLYYPISYFAYQSETPLEEILIAIAGVQRKLFFYGYNADAEEEKRHSAVSPAQPLEGQISLLSAS